MTTYDKALRLARINQKIKELSIEADAIKDELRSEGSQILEPNADDLGIERSLLTAPTLEVKVSPNSRIDDKLAREVLDDATYSTVSKTVIDTAKARAFLTERQLDQITKKYGDKVEVKVL